LTIDNDQVSKHLESIREEHRLHSQQVFDSHAKEIDLLEARNCKLLETLDKRDEQLLQLKDELAAEQIESRKRQANSDFYL
jgi:vacuolar-type H+-ATPase subunit B/Vma2